MLKVIQGGIRMSFNYSGSPTGLVAGMGIVPASGTVALPTTVSGTMPLGLVFDSTAEASSFMNVTGGGGGSDTLMESTAQSTNDITVITGTFVGQTDQFSGITSSDIGSRLTVNTDGKLIKATTTGAYIIGEVIGVPNTTDVKFLFNSAGAKV